MNMYLFGAGVVMTLLAIIHSVLGERLIFRHIAPDSPNGQAARALLPSRRWLALRGTWHLVSILSAGLSLSAWAVAIPIAAAQIEPGLVLSATFIVMSMYWVWATKGSHPAWVGFLITAGLLALGLPTV